MRPAAPRLAFAALLLVAAGGGALLLHRGAGGPPGPDRLEEALQQGDGALLEGRLEEAERAFRRALRAEPANGRALFGLGLALLRSGRADEALGPFEEAARIDPSNGDYLYLRARSLAALGRREEAIGAYRSLVEGDKNRPGAVEELVALLSAAGRREEAASIVGDAASRWPERFSLRLLAGRTLGVLGRHEEAAAHYAAARTLRPYAPEPIYGLIASYRGLERIQESLDLMPEFERLQARVRALEGLAERARAAPSDPGPSETLIEALLAEGRIEPALEEAGRHLRSFPGSPRSAALALSAARAAAEAGEVELVRDLLRALAHGGDLSIEDRLAAAELRLQMGDFADAVVGFDACLRESPGQAQALLGRARAFLGAGDLGPARADLLRALAAIPEDAGVHATLGLLQAREGDIRGALGSFKEALERDAENLEATFGLGFIAYQRQELAEAESRLRRVVERQPSHRDALTLLALAMADQGRCADAFPVLRRCLAADPSNARLHAALVQCFEWGGLSEQAERARQEAERALSGER